MLPIAVDDGRDEDDPKEGQGSDDTDGFRLKRGIPVFEVNQRAKGGYHQTNQEIGQKECCH